MVRSVFFLFLMLPFGKAKIDSSDFILGIKEKTDEKSVLTDDNCQDNKQILPQPLDIAGQKFDTVYICPNGLVALGEPFNEWNPISMDFPGKSFIAVGWADSDITGNDISDPPTLSTTLSTSSPLKQPELDFVLEEILNEQKLTHKANNVAFNTSITHRNKPELKNVYWRINCDKTSDDIRDFKNYVREHWYEDIDFKPSCVLVATWYYVPMYKQLRDKFNTFQLLIGYRESYTVLVYNYIDLEWGMNLNSQSEPMRAGYYIKTNDKPIYDELPGSGTDHVTDLEKTSNVNDTGRYIIALGKNGPIPEPVVVDQPIEIHPNKANMYDDSKTFVITGTFSLTGTSEVQLKFVGKSRTVLIETPALSVVLTNKNGKPEVKGVLPLWIHYESVEVQLYDNGKFLGATEVFYFSKPTEDWQTQIAWNETASQYIVSWDTKNPFLNCGLKKCEVAVRVDFYPKNGLEKQEGKKIIVNAKEKMLVESFDVTEPGFLVATVANIEGKITDLTLFDGFTRSPNPVFVSPLIMCKYWVLQEEQKHSLDNSAPCYTNMSNFYGCPQNQLNQVGLTDASFAEKELKNGAKIWLEDPCCSQDSKTTTRSEMSNLCNHCELNAGANFCIVSKPYECTSKSGQLMPEMSNQCCYDNSGNLIEDKSKGAGLVSKQDRMLYSDLDFFAEHVIPYRSCVDEEKAYLFPKYRPTYTGNYWSRPISTPNSGSQITTFDGFVYSVESLNVYTLFKTKNINNQGLDVEVQISNKKVGGKMEFAGIAVRETIEAAGEDKKISTLEFYNNFFGANFIKLNGFSFDMSTPLEVSIEKHGLPFEPLYEYKTPEMNVYLEVLPNSENPTAERYVFEFVKSGLVIYVLNDDSNKLTFDVSPPLGAVGSNNAVGLLGNINCKESDDLIKQDGTKVKTSSSSDFVDSWVVPQEKWIFETNPIKVLIMNDLAEGASVSGLRSMRGEKGFISPEARRKIAQLGDNNEKRKKFMDRNANNYSSFDLPQYKSDWRSDGHSLQATFQKFNPYYDEKCIWDNSSASFGSMAFLMSILAAFMMLS